MKKIYQITIEDYSMFEKTGKTKYLRHWYEFPFKPSLEKLLNEIKTILSDNGGILNELSREKHKMLFMSDIQELTALYWGAFNLIVNSTKIDVWKKRIGLKVKVDQNKNLKKYLERIEKRTRLKIKTVKDLENLSNIIDFKVNRFMEMFNSKEINNEGKTTFIKLVFIVFSILNRPMIEYKMSLSDFAELKEMANDHVRMLKKTYDK